ncbi:MAG TPA: hypothetical protein VMX36_12410 [Sedimentisphaerales bacterium]|nr:hypothetical protein [Sedimentisphaerales bacterium]
MRIVPAIDSSDDIGNLGIKEGTATIYPWKWYYSAPALGLWIILALVILLVRDNRDPRVLLIFIPIFLVRLLWSWFQPILGAPSEVLEVFRVLIDALAVGIAVLWLLAYKLGNRNRFVSLLLALVVLVAATIVAIVSYQAWLSGAAFAIFVIQALGIVTMLLVFVLAGWRCRKRYGPWRFMLWLALWTMVISLVAIITYFLISVGPSGEELIQQIPQVLLVGLIFAICVYVLNLPFMILAFTTPFFRRRFYAYFHLKSMPIGSSSGTEKPRSGDLEQTE